MRAGGAALIAFVVAAIPATVAASDPAFESRAVQQLVVERDGGILAAGYTRQCHDVEAPVCDPGHPFVVRLTAKGRIDRSYGDNGWAELPAGLDPEPIDAIGLQSGGRLVLTAGDESSSRLFRLRADGAPDAGFGAGGSVVTSDAAFVADGGRSGLAVGDGDEIYVSEHSRDEADHSYAVARFDANGVPDPAFAGGRAVVDLGAASGATWTSGLAVGDGGAVTVGGDVYSDGTSQFAARFRADGSLDAGFGTAGVAELSLSNTAVGDLAALDDGGTAILGLVVDPVASHDCCTASLFAIDEAGAVGTSFTRAGIQRVFRGAIARASGGGVLLAGTEDVPYGGSGPMRVRVSRYRSSGSLDGPFGGDGTSAVRIGGLRSTAGTVAPGPGDTVLVGGSTSSGHCNPSDDDPAGVPCDSAVVMRFRRDGKLDSSFGRGGVAGLPRFSFCPTMPTTRCGYDLDGDGFAAAVAGVVSPRARLDARRLRVRVGCPRIVAAPCRFRLNVTARKRDRLGARVRALVVEPGQARFAHLRLRRPVARRIARSGSAIVWSAVRAETQRHAARGWARVAVQGGSRHQ